jgi:hypothetical protein
MAMAPVLGARLQARQGAVVPASRGQIHRRPLRLCASQASGSDDAVAAPAAAADDAAAEGGAAQGAGAVKLEAQPVQLQSWSGEAAASPADDDWGDGPVVTRRTPRQMLLGA